MSTKSRRLFEKHNVDKQRVLSLNFDKRNRAIDFQSFFV